MKQSQWNISAEAGLDAETLAQAQGLAEEVRQTDGVILKIDWESAEEQVPGQSNNFCCRAGGRLVGYAFLEGAGKELEVTAAVSPSLRRQGIFKALLRAATDEAQKRDATELLLISYRASVSGKATVKALGLPYMFSEYRMEAAAESMPTPDAQLLRLVQVDMANASVLAQMTEQIFGKPSAALYERLQQEGSRYFFAELERVRVGQIGVAEAEDSLYIRGVGILPEQRKQGYGHQLLAALLKQMLAEGHTRFTLEVATDNPQALSLYHSCGFHETTIYDYHAVKML